MDKKTNPLNIKKIALLSKPIGSKPLKQILIGKDVNLSSKWTNPVNGSVEWSSDRGVSPVDYGPIKVGWFGTEIQTSCIPFDSTNVDISTEIFYFPSSNDQMYEIDIFGFDKNGIEKFWIAITDYERLNYFPTLYVRVNFNELYNKLYYGHNQINKIVISKRNNIFKLINNESVLVDTVIENVLLDIDKVVIKFSRFQSYNALYNMGVSEIIIESFE